MLWALLKHATILNYRLVTHQLLLHQGVTRNHISVHTAYCLTGMRCLRIQPRSSLSPLLQALRKGHQFASNYLFTHILQLSRDFRLLLHNCLTLHLQSVKDTAHTLTSLNLPLEGFRKAISYSYHCYDKTPYRSSSREKGVLWLTVCRPSQSWQNPGVNLCLSWGQLGYIVSIASVLVTFYWLGIHHGQRHL